MTGAQSLLATGLEMTMPRMLKLSAVCHQFIPFKKAAQGHGLSMKVSLSWQKKALILLALSLVFLCAVLAVVAIREAERERMVSERGIEDRQKRAVSLVSDRAQAVLAGLENRVLAVLPPSRADLAPDEMAAVSRRVLENPENRSLLQEVFFQDAAGSVTFPSARPLYLFPGDKAGLREIPPIVASQVLWKEAEDAEYRRKEYAQAADAYERLLTRFPDALSRPFILFRLGRCFQKAGYPQRTLAVYQDILKAGRPELSSDGIPLELMALLQIADIHSKGNRLKEAAAAHFAVYESLLSAKWALTKSQFEFYRRITSDELQALLARAGSKESDNAWTELKHREGPELRRTARLEGLRQTVVPLIVAAQRGSPAASPKFSRFSAPSMGDVLLVSYLPLAGSAVIGLVLDPASLARTILPQGPGRTGLGEGCLIRLEDASGRPMAGEDIPPADTQPAAPRLSSSSGFEDGFPPWNINVYRTGPDRSLREFNLKRTLYILLVLVVTAALFLGGYLAIRATAKELELAKLKSDFVSTVSHEFRTPLTSIRYLAELLERGRVRDDEKKLEYFRTIGRESERLSRFVENILDFSKIEAGMKEFRMEETDVAGLSRDIARLFLKQTAHKNVSLETDIAGQLPKIVADSDAVSRAVLNLLDNAAKYSGENPRIIFRVRAEDGNIILEVEDNGTGISPADQKRVFERFFRAERAASGAVKGSGIGLTLVDHIVRAHGGKVTLASEPGRGTKVTIRLPARPPHASKEEGRDG